MKRKERLKLLIKRLPGSKRYIDFYRFCRDKIFCRRKNMTGQITALVERVNGLQQQIMDYQDAAQYNRMKDDPQDRLAVYTVITGNYDTLKKPRYIDTNCDYFCITNNKALTSDFYRMIYIDDTERMGNARLSRYPKINPHLFFPDYKHSLYVDANFTIMHSVWSWIFTYSRGRDMLMFFHPDRDCIYDEGIACIETNKDCPKVINQQLERYRKEGYPSHHGLISGGILYRKHNLPAMRAVDEMWWDELQKGSKRDQLSFNYVCYRTGFQYDSCPLNYFKSPYFSYVGHI